MNINIRRLKETGFFHVLGSGVLNKAVAFLGSVLLVHILSKSEYGVFTYAWNIYSLVLLFNGLGLESGVLQVCSEHGGDESYARNVFAYSSKTGTLFDILLALILLGIGLFAPLTIQGSGTLIRMLCLLPIFQLFFNLSAARLRAEKRNREYARLTMLNTAVLFAASAIGAAFFREKGLVTGYYIAYGISDLAVLSVLKQKGTEQLAELDGAERKTLLSISLVSMCSNGLSQLLYLLDIFVLGLITADETVLAGYQVATVIPTALIFLPGLLIIYVYPYFAEHRKDGAWCLKHYRQLLGFLVIMNLLISCILYFFAPKIIGLLYGSRYTDAVPIFRVLAVSYFISGTFRTPSGNLLVTQRKLKFNFLAALISGTVNIIADYFFVLKWGAIGAAYATVLVVLVSGMMSTSYLLAAFHRASRDSL